RRRARAVRRHQARAGRPPLGVRPALRRRQGRGRRGNRRAGPRGAGRMIRVCVAGVTGWTGSAVAAAIRAADDLELVAGVSRSDPESHPSVAEALEAAAADVVVDYTHAAAVKDNVLAALERGVGVVV